VKSFAESGAEYFVVIDKERKLLLSCSCADYVQHKIPCKHFYLIVRVYLEVKINYIYEPEQVQDTVDINDLFGPSLEDLLSEETRFKLQAARSEERERKQKADKEAIDGRWRRCQEQLEAMYLEMGRLAHITKQIKFTLEYMESTLDEAKRMMLKLRGTTVVGAGNRCQ
jgi:uncharacterized Zn finger protein